MSGSRLFAAIAVIAFISVVRAAPQEIIEALLRYKQQCIDLSGSDEGYRQTLVAIPEMKICIFNKVDVLEMQQEVTSISESKSDRKMFFDKYCPQFNESVSCFDDLFESVAKCIGEDSDQIVPVFRDVAYGVVELICENDGQFLLDAQKPEFKDCLVQLRESVQECRLTNMTHSVSLIHYGEEQCREVETSRECVKQKVDECNAPAVYNIFEILFNRIMKWTNCHQYNKVVELYNNNVDGAN